MYVFSLFRFRNNFFRRILFIFIYQFDDKINLFMKNIGGLEKDRLFYSGHSVIYLAALSDFLGRRTAWMLGRTPPWAMVTPASSLFNSSSFLMASWR